MPATKYPDGLSTTTIAASGAVTLDSTLAVAGAFTPTGGVGNIAGTRTRFNTVDTVAATAGTDTACDATSVWVAEINVTANCTLTGLEYLIGSVGGTDSVIVSIYTAAGVLLANSALAGTTVGTAAQLQKVPFTATYACKGPQTLLAALSFNGTTAKFRSIPAFAGQRTHRVKQLTNTFGTLVAISPVPTALVADVGPILSTY